MIDEAVVMINSKLKEKLIENAKNGGSGVLVEFHYNEIAKAIESLKTIT